MILTFSFIQFEFDGDKWIVYLFWRLAGSVRDSVRLGLFLAGIQ